ncbi:MAG: erythrose-4-phosphate dehydrogenase, partial [Holosporaceae bacterium]|nr:erythrose-4-phosphate dehydrogenase [Holosporaceae bacterium]
MKIAVNGFGRIGRLTLRAFSESAAGKYGFDIVAVNDLQNIDTALHLLKYDSVHGRINAEIQKISESEFLLNGKKIICLSEPNPEKLPWGRLGVDLVAECTGMFGRRELCESHLRAGAAKVLVSGPMKDADRTIIFGINRRISGRDSEKDLIVSNGSCTTNCAAHLLNAIHGEIGVINGFITTVHACTGDQRTVDTNHKDLRRARAAASNIIPTSTGLTETVGKIFPELEGKLSALSLRVPTQNVSLVNFTFTASKKITKEDVRRAILAYANVVPRDIFDCTDEPLVSSDFNHSPCSAVVDLSLTRVFGENMGHAVAWYDNEWGFSNRMLDSA